MQLGFALASVVVVVAGCGGPHINERAVSTKAFESNARCTQGPVDAHFKATGYKWGESISIRACGPHGLNAQAQVLVDGRWRNGGTVGTAEFDNRRCVLSDAEVVARSTSGRVGVDSAVAAPRSGNGATVVADAPGVMSAFRESARRLDRCWEQTMVFGLEKLRPGADIHVRLWADEPQDLQGALIQITHNDQVPSVSDAKWKAHLEAEERAYQRDLERDERLRGKDTPASQAELRARIESAEVYAGPTGPPPPARVERVAPRPSVNAEWVPGYWQWHAEAWLWMAGQWRVPLADVHAGRTVRAPFAPPPLRDEIPDRAPVGAVWAPGYWAWDGNVYVWIAGTWRLPPSTAAKWQSGSWRVEIGGAVFVPGGWSGR